VVDRCRSPSKNRTLAKTLYMPLNDFATRDEGAELKELSFYRHRFILRPEYWQAYANPAALTWQVVRAKASEVLRIPNTDKGIYSFVVDASTASHPGTKYLLYIGKAEKQSFRTRFKQYLAEADDPKGRPLIKDMFRKWPDHLWFYFAPVATIGDIHQLEEDLIGAFAPPQNDELPAEIRRPVKAAWRT
jgi:hypothetical protein